MLKNSKHKIHTGTILLFRVSFGNNYAKVLFSCSLKPKHDLNTHMLDNSSFLIMLKKQVSKDKYKQYIYHWNRYTL